MHSTLGMLWVIPHISEIFCERWGLGGDSSDEDLARISCNALDMYEVDLQRSKKGLG